MKFLPNGVSVLVLWFARVLWLPVGLLAPWSDIADGRSAAVAATVTAWGWLLWGSVLVALSVPSTVSLTVARSASPLVVVAGYWSGGTAQVVVSAVAFGVLWTGETADALVQGSAYGAETRFCLRTPLVHVLAAVPAWSAWAGSIIGGSLLVAAGNPMPGAGLLVVGALLSRTVPRRLHRFSRRWLVLVPSGIVVHDHMVLAETVMVRRSNLSGVQSVAPGGDPADLTGGTFGRRISFVLANAEKVILTPIARRVLRTSEALHVQSFTVNPVRRVPALARLQKR
ncbi:MAG: hypothetical protein ACO36A_05385 [Ilumatobacteraceae bacterium]